MAAIYNDSSFSTKYGTAYLPITGAPGVGAVTGSFLAENITITVPSQSIDIRNHLNEPAGRILTPDFVNGSATVQVSGSFPNIGSTFGFDGTVYYLSEIGQTFALGDIYKASVNFNKKYN